MTSKPKCCFLFTAHSLRYRTIRGLWERGFRDYAEHSTTSRRLREVERPSSGPEHLETTPAFQGCLLPFPYVGDVLPVSVRWKSRTPCRRTRSRQQTILDDFIEP